MDIISDKPMAYPEIVKEISGKQLRVGAKQIRKALASGKVSRVYLAQNADPAITEPIMTLCQLNDVGFAWVWSMTDLGRACGIDVGAAVAATVNLC